jgi:hypothetical protein
MEQNKKIVLLLKFRIIFPLKMALLTVGLCPEILSEPLLSIFRLELNIKKIQDFLEADPKKLANFVNTLSLPPSQKRAKTLPESQTQLTVEDILFVRKKVFERFSIVATNVGDGFDCRNLREKETIQTGLTDSVQYLNLENF